jgi:hypothetical protein
LSSPKPAPLRARRRKIQLPYPNTYKSIWEYRESFLSGQIDFVSFLGPTCPICGKKDCYRGITPYWRYAIDLFPEFRKERVPVARFLCDKRQSTFSLLPTQLIPYFQYTVNAVIGTLLLVLKLPADGTEGFSWRLGGGGSGQPPDPMADCLLAWGGCARVPACPWGVETMVQPDTDKIFIHDCRMGRSIRVFSVFRLASANPLGPAASLSCEPIQPQHKNGFSSAPLPNPASGSHCPPMIFRPSGGCCKDFSAVSFS